MHLVQGRSRSEVIGWYFGEYPEIRRFVDRHIEAGSCAEAVAELRSAREKRHRWLLEQHGDIPTPERNSDFDWMDEFRIRPKETAALPAPAENAVALNKPKPTNLAVLQWIRDRITSWPDDKPAPSEGDDWDAARQHFAHGLTRDEFRAVRNSETPGAWRVQGPRKLWGQVKN